MDYRCRLDLDYLLAGAHVLELGIICKFQNSGLLLRRCLHSSHTLHAIIRRFAVGRHWVSVGFFSPPSTSRQHLFILLQKQQRLYFHLISLKQLGKEGL